MIKMAPRTRKGSRVRRAVGILVILGGLAVVGVAAISQTAACRDWLRRQVLTRLNAQMTGRRGVTGMVTPGSWRAATS